MVDGQVMAYFRNFGVFSPPIISVHSHVSGLFALPNEVGSCSGH